MLHKVGSRAYSDIQRETERERERARAHERERERKRERDSDIEGASQEAHSAQRFWHLTSGRDFFFTTFLFFLSTPFRPGVLAFQQGISSFSGGLVLGLVEDV
jgi:hypothetical protein